MSIRRRTGSLRTPAHALTLTLALALLVPALTVLTPVPHAAASPAVLSRAVPFRAAPSPRGRFGWPLAPPHPVVRPFLPPATPFGPGHRGVDLGGSVDEPVLAAGAGLVVFAGDLAGRPLVSVEHPGGLRTTYEPVRPAVAVGGQVARGDLIGWLRPGHQGCGGQAHGEGPDVRPVGEPVTATCLHWGARRGGDYLNPLRLVTTGHVRLLPWPHT
jgi:murein DD-endopeptidase MepM/ murein hydrolase activator NlpD